MQPLLSIIHEDPNFLVVNKPAGLLVHPDKYSQEAGQTSVAELLLTQFPELEKVGAHNRQGAGSRSPQATEDDNRGGIVHRLDREASGLLVVARTQPMYESLIKQFAEHTIKKEYLVLVYGQMKDDQGTIDLPLQRYRDRTRMFATKIPDINRPAYPAITHWTLIEQYSKVALLKITTETGRLHQIRVHLTHVGRPVVGEAHYTVSKQTRTGVPKLERLFLHACTLGFMNLDNKQQEFECKLPVELQNYLERVKK